MPEITEGRVSLVIFFSPDHDNLERRQWQTITDDADQEDGDDREGQGTQMPVTALVAPGTGAIRQGVDTSLRLSVLWGDGGGSNTQLGACDHCDLESSCEIDLVTSGGTFKVR